MVIVRICSVTPITHYFALLKETIAKRQAQDGIRGVTFPIRASDKPAHLSLAFGSEWISQ